MENVIDRNGRLLKFKTIGDGTPIFIVGFSSYTYNCLSSIIKSKYKFIIHDYYGATDPNNDNYDLSIPNLLEDIKYIQDFLGYEKINIMGHSSSGTVALDYSLLYPDKINKLILICSPIVYDEDFIIEQQNYMRLYLNEERKNIFDQNIYDFNMRVEQGEILNFFKEYHKVQTPLYYYDFNFDPGNDWNGIEVNIDFITTFVEKTYKIYKRKNNIESIKNKIISIIGTHDFATPWTTWEKYINFINVIKIENCGHYPMIEKSELFDDIILKNVNVVTI